MRPDGNEIPRRTTGSRAKATQCERRSTSCSGWSSSLLTLFPTPQFSSHWEVIATCHDILRGGPAYQRASRLHFPLRLPIGLLHTLIGQSASLGSTTWSPELHNIAAQPSEVLLDHTPRRCVLAGTTHLLDCSDRCWSAYDGRLAANTVQSPLFAASTTTLQSCLTER